MKRILSLEGGEIRSLYSLQVLSKVEALLKERANNPSYKLCDHFDLITGTSAGAIIGSGFNYQIETTSDQEAPIE